MSIVTEHINLRTLTRKSILYTEGSWAGKTVQQLMDDHPGVLVWAYFHRENINFMEDILFELNICKRIAKPGKDPEAYIQRRWMIARALADKGDKKLLYRLMRERRMQKKEALKINKAWDDWFCSKARLTWKNQGH